MKISNIMDLDFNSIKNLDDNDFIDKLKLMGYNTVICGQDFRFGKDRKGTTQSLKNHFDVTVVDIENIDNEKISTTTIVEELKKGDLDYFYKTHGFKYFVKGEVIKGDQIGRTINFPTININVDFKIIPNFGSYSSNVFIDEKLMLGATYIGKRPSVNGSDLRFETFIMDFDELLYSRVVKVELIIMTRQEMKFSSLDELKKQIVKDVNDARNKR